MRVLALAALAAFALAPILPAATPDIVPKPASLTVREGKPFVLKWGQTVAGDDRFAAAKLAEIRTLLKKDGEENAPA